MFAGGLHENRLTDLEHVHLGMNNSPMMTMSIILGAGQSTQSLQQGSSAPGNAATTNNQSVNRNYAESMAKVKYNFTGKLTADVGLGARYVASNIPNSREVGLKPVKPAKSRLN